MSATIRRLSVDDVEEVTALLQQNREFLAPWEPTREDEYFHPETQREIARQSLDEHVQGRTFPAVILDDGAIVGRLTLSGITRGAFQSAAMGYWVSERANGRGVATRAVSAAIAVAFGELGLHRLQAETVVANAASQRVLAKNGFRPYGAAPDYLRIDGRWQDHILFQLISSSSTTPPHASIRPRAEEDPRAGRREGDASESPTRGSSDHSHLDEVSPTLRTTSGDGPDIGWTSAVDFGAFRRRPSDAPAGGDDMRRARPAAPDSLRRGAPPSSWRVLAR